jgi:hypothetical protein
VLRFADYLYAGGDYLRAAGEYRRYIFYMEGIAETDSIYYRMIRAVFLGGDYVRCEWLLGDFTSTYPSSPIGTDIPLSRAVLQYHQGDYTGSLGTIEGEVTPDSDLKRKIAAMSCLHLGEIERARRWACGAQPDDIGTEQGDTGSRTAYLCRQITAAASLPHKSRLLAGALSAVVPGSGKVYCGRVADGIYSFLIVGLFAWQAYDGFEEDGTSSVKGWIFGVLGTGFYLGNIYGSTVAAELYNQRVYDDFVRGLKIEITLP